MTAIISCHALKIHSRNSSEATWGKGVQQRMCMHYLCTHTYIMSMDEYLCDPGEGKTLLSINENRESSAKSPERLRQEHHRFKAILGKSV